MPRPRPTPRRACGAARTRSNEPASISSWASRLSSRRCAISVPRRRARDAERSRVSSVPPRSPRTRPRSASERRRAHVERICGLEHVDPLGRVQQGPHQAVEAIARGSGIRPRRPQRRGGVGARAISLRAGLDDRTRGHARVQRGDIRADAARRDAERVGERRRRRPVAVAHEQCQEPILSRSCHGHSSCVAGGVPAAVAVSVTSQPRAAADQGRQAGSPGAVSAPAETGWLSAPSDFTRMAERKADR